MSVLYIRALGLNAVHCVGQRNCNDFDDRDASPRRKAKTKIWKNAPWVTLKKLAK
jgi:hypothetical protein